MKLPKVGEVWRWRGCLRHEVTKREVIVSDWGYIGQMSDAMKREVVQCCLVFVEDKREATRTVQAD